MEISGRVAVVTGASSGLGRAMALALSSRGAKVVCADVDVEGGGETITHIQAGGGTAAFERCDVTHPEDLSRVFAAAVERFGGFDILCNNAGIGGEDLFNDPAGKWRRIIDINLTAVIDGTRQAVQVLGGRGGGVIVNTASMGGLVPMPHGPVYAAAKAGVVHFTRSLAYLAEECNVRVNAICPSYADTPLIYRSDNAETVAVMKQRLGGLVQPAEVAGGVVELVEDDSRAGAIMRVTLRNGRDYARELRA